MTHLVSTLQRTERQTSRPAKVNLGGWVVVFASIAIGGGLAGSIRADSPVADSPVADSPVADSPVAADQKYHGQLVSLAEKCDQLGLTEQAATSREWFLVRDPRRHYWFLPAPEDPYRPADSAPKLVQSWYRKFTQYRKLQAERLFEQARRLSQEGEEARAYRMLHEVLREDPEHIETRRILGYIKTARGWQVAQRGPMAVAPQRFHWQGTRNWTIDHGHFRVTTNVNRQAAGLAAEYLEMVYSVWRQLFFDYWSVPGRLAARCNGRDVSLGPSRKFQIVLFRDREEYIKQLRQFEPRIEISVGYYSRNSKTAFFFAGDDKTRKAWAHEVTHQFFQESGAAVALVGESSNFWVVEGVALYMESLIQASDYCTTGGIDAGRLQFARYRTLNEGYQVPLEELVTYGRVRIQNHQDIRRLYSYSAGLTHFFVNDQRGRLLRPFVEYVQAVYRGQANLETLSKRVGQGYAELGDGYRRSLNVSDDDLSFVSRNCRELCLGHTAVTDRGLKKLTACDQLRWLDLSFTTASDRGLANFANARQLRQLNLEKTAVTDQAMKTISRFGQLEELDLAQTAIGDDALDRMADLTEMKVLWLTSTNITDRGLQKLAPLRNLEKLDVQGTEVTKDALKQLRGSQ